MNFQLYLAKRQEEADAITLTDPEQVAALPWAGNHASDCCLFEKVDRYIRSEPDLRKRQRADQLASIHGMGEYCEIDPDYDPANPNK